MRIAVIIPFFQSKPGLLSQAVNSIINANNNSNIEIIIIDDESPIHHSDELSEINLNDCTHIQLHAVRQKNTGVVGARNAGLNLVNDDIDIITFLDADDYWQPSRADKLVTAFIAGADFYFSDFTRKHETISRFTWSGIARNSSDCFDEQRQLSWFSGDIVSQICIGRCPVGTSTLAYRRTPVTKSLRFHTEFKRCAEDIFFFAQLADLFKSTGKIAISHQADVMYDVGVGLETSATWGSLAGLQKCIDVCRLHTLLENILNLNPENHLQNSVCIKKMDVDFFENLIVTSFKNKTFPRAMMQQYFSFRPILQMSYIKAIVNLIKKKL